MEIEEVREKRIQEKIREIDAVANDIPGVVVIHRNDLSTLYMSPRGLHQLGISLHELKNLSVQSYHEQFFNPEDAKDYVPKIADLMLRNTDETVSFFQQVRLFGKPEWIWHISSIKILLRDDDGQPLLFITIAFPVDELTHITRKVSRLLEENEFLRKNYNQFASLGKREKDVLKLLALGKSSAQIAEELFISVATVETHRKNIRQKLDASSMYDLSLYARAFDLI